MGLWHQSCDDYCAQDRGKKALTSYSSGDCRQEDSCLKRGKGDQSPVVPGLSSCAGFSVGHCLFLKTASQPLSPRMSCGHHPIENVSYSDFRDSLCGWLPTLVLECLPKKMSLPTFVEKILLSQEQLDKMCLKYHMEQLPWGRGGERSQPRGRWL